MKTTGNNTTDSSLRSSSLGAFRNTAVTTGKTRPIQGLHSDSIDRSHETYFMHNSDVLARIGDPRQNKWVSVAKLIPMRSVESDRKPASEPDNQTSSRRVNVQTSTQASMSSNNAASDADQRAAVISRVAQAVVSHIQTNLRSASMVKSESMLREVRDTLSFHLERASGNGAETAQLISKAFDFAGASAGIKQGCLKVEMKTTTQGNTSELLPDMAIADGVTPLQIHRMLITLTRAKESPEELMELYKDSPDVNKFLPEKYSNLAEHTQSLLHSFKQIGLSDANSNNLGQLLKTSDLSVMPFKKYSVQIQKHAAIERTFEPERAVALLVLGDGKSEIESIWNNQIQVIENTAELARINLTEWSQTDRSIDGARKRLDKINTFIEKVIVEDAQSRMLPHFYDIKDDITRKITNLGDKSSDLKNNAEQAIRDVRCIQKEISQFVADNRGTISEASLDRLEMFSDGVFLAGMRKLDDPANKKTLAIVDSVISNSTIPDDSIRKAARESLLSAYVDKMHDLGIGDPDLLTNATELAKKVFTSASMNPHLEKHKESSNSYIDQLKSYVNYSNPATLGNSTTPIGKALEESKLYIESIRDNLPLLSTTYLQTIFQNISGNFDRHDYFADSQDVIDGFEALSNDINIALNARSQQSEQNTIELLESTTNEFNDARNELEIVSKPFLGKSKVLSSIVSQLAKYDHSLTRDVQQSISTLQPIINALSPAIDTHDIDQHTCDKLVAILGKSLSRQLSDEHNCSNPISGRKVFETLKNSDVEDPPEPVRLARGPLLEIDRLLGAMKKELDSVSDEDKKSLNSVLSKLKSTVEQRDSLLRTMSPDNRTGTVKQHIDTMVRAAILSERPQGLGGLRLSEKESMNAKPTGQSISVVDYEGIDASKVVSRLKSWGLNTDKFMPEILVGAAGVSSELASKSHLHINRSPIALPEELAVHGGNNGELNVKGWMGDIPPSEKREAAVAFKFYEQGLNEASDRPLSHYLEMSKASDLLLTSKMVSANDLHVQEKRTASSSAGMSFAPTFSSSDLVNSRPPILSYFANPSFDATSGQEIDVKRGFGGYEVRIRDTSQYSLKLGAGAGWGIGAGNFDNQLKPRSKSDNSRTDTLFNFNVNASVNVEFSRGHESGVSIALGSAEGLREMMEKCQLDQFTAADILDLCDSVETVKKSNMATELGGRLSSDIAVIGNALRRNFDVTAAYSGLKSRVEYEGAGSSDDKGRFTKSVSYGFNNSSTREVPLTAPNLAGTVVSDRMKAGASNGTEQVIASLSGQQGATLGLTFGRGGASMYTNSTLERGKVTTDGIKTKKVEMLRTILYDTSKSVAETLFQLGGRELTNRYANQLEFANQIDKLLVNAHDGDSLAIEYKMNKAGYQKIIDLQHMAVVLEMTGNNKELENVNNELAELRNPSKSSGLKAESMLLSALNADFRTVNIREVAVFSNIGSASVTARVSKGFIRFEDEISDRMQASTGVQEAKTSDSPTPLARERIDSGEIKIEDSPRPSIKAMQEGRSPRPGEVKIENSSKPSSGGAGESKMGDLPSLPSDPIARREAIRNDSSDISERSDNDTARRDSSPMTQAPTDEQKSVKDIRRVWEERVSSSRQLLSPKVKDIATTKNKPEVETREKIEGDVDQNVNISTTTPSSQEKKAPTE